MYKLSINYKTQFNLPSLKEGELLETKVQRITTNKEPIKDGAPTIYTERKEGVLAGYNIRTDRWDVALNAMNAVNKSKITKNKNWLKNDETNKTDGNTESPVVPSEAKKTLN